MWGEMWSGMYDNIWSLKPASWTSEAAYSFFNDRKGQVYTKVINDILLP